MKTLSKKTSRRIWKTSLFVSLILIVFTGLLSACGEQAARQENGSDVYIPPTLSHIPTATPLNTPTPTTPPTPTTTCTNDLTFVADVTVEDDTEFAPNTEVIKTWRVQNSGSCNWDSEYTVRLVNGSPMGVSTTQPLFPARSGAEAEVTITFTAPSDAGRVSSTWQAHDPNGNPFGQTFFVQIIVNPDLVEGEGN